MQKFELIVFDCDGVLVDSERIANEVFAKILNEECGFALTLEDMFDQFVGRSLSQCMEIVERRLGKAPPPGLEERYNKEINQALQESVVAVNGVESVLDEIDIPYCVASGGSYEKMHTTLGKTDLMRYFDGRLNSVSDVKRGKPFPDVYLLAAERMAVEPSRCLVVEDSPPGVQGGVAAGMVVFGYCELMEKEKLVEAGAHHTFGNMRNLADDIRSFESNIL